MFADLLKRLTTPTETPLQETDARLALTALLVRVARSDNDYAPAERQRIDQITQARYGLTPQEAAALRAQGEEMETQAPDTVRFTREIKDAVAYDDRLAVIQAMWSVVLADGGRANEENALLRLVANLLGVPDTDSARARQQVENRAKS